MPELQADPPRTDPGVAEGPASPDADRGAGASAGRQPAAPRQADLAHLARRLVLDRHGPAAVLIDSRHEALFFLGPTDRYLRVASGHPTQDLLAMTRSGLRSRLKAAIDQVVRERTCVVVPGGHTMRDGGATAFSVEVQPVPGQGDLLLVCFLDEPLPRSAPTGPRVAAPQPLEPLEVTELQQALETTQTELRDAVRDLETSSEQHKAASEQALSVTEEYQSSNEELVASKQELQSLNEALTALNGQLGETLERQRTTSDDLQNVLYSTDIATLFLDAELRIRFFTPATRTVFNVIPSDVGRPLADLRSLAGDDLLPDDARAVMKDLAPIEREVGAPDQRWFTRRVSPYRTHGGEVHGVVITFTDVTERKRVAGALELAREESEAANLGKSRFLAAVSHDLRQPLQTLALLHGLLARSVEGEPAQALIARVDNVLATMSGMLDTLLDLKRLEAGVVHAEITTFRVNSLLEQLRAEFSYHAQAQGLSLRVVPCSLLVRSDRRLLEQMIRNLLSNALKYTERGKVLLGCRRHADSVTIEVWDMGIGIPGDELKTIFEEYRQVDNAARERTRGLGLGLSIVQRLGHLLGHKVRVTSRPAKGSVFAVEVALPPGGSTPAGLPARRDEHPGSAHRIGTILVVEDDPDLRELLELCLRTAGHRVAVARDGVSALDLLERGVIRPDLVLADYNLPNHLDGLQLAAMAREKLAHHLPVVILTGDSSAAAQHKVALQGCVHMNKPVGLAELTQALDRLLPASLPFQSMPFQSRPQEPSAEPPAMPLPGSAGRGGPVQDAAARRPPGTAETATIFIVDDDRQLRNTACEVLEREGHRVRTYATSEEFLAAYHPGDAGCLLLDAYLPGLSGLDLLQRLREGGDRLPAIMITGNSDVTIAVQAMKAGASDFIEKPIGYADLLASIDRALEGACASSKRRAWHETAASHIAGLTPRQQQVMTMVLAGHPSKNIAVDLGISQRTVENHRASIMKRTGSHSLPALARMAIAAGREADGPSDGGATNGLGRH